MGNARLALVLGLLVAGLVLGLVVFQGTRDREAPGQPESRQTALASGTVIVVRHAEKLTEGDDPSLSEAGRARAALLVSMVRDAEVGALVSSPYARTVETLEPLAEAHGLQIETIPIAGGDTGAHSRAVAARCLQLLSRGTVVVAGHSNTVPAIVRALGGDPGPDISDDEYDGFYVVNLDADGGVRCIKLRYGTR